MEENFSSYLSRPGSHSGSGGFVAFVSGTRIQRRKVSEVSATWTTGDAKGSWTNANVFPCKPGLPIRTLIENRNKKSDRCWRNQWSSTTMFFLLFMKFKLSWPLLLVWNPNRKQSVAGDTRMFLLLSILLHIHRNQSSEKINDSDWLGVGWKLKSTGATTVIGLFVSCDFPSSQTTTCMFAGKRRLLTFIRYRLK